MSPAGSVIVFFLIVVVFFVVLFVVTMDRGTRGQARLRNSKLVDSRSHAPINVDDEAIAKRLNALAPKAGARNPQSVDIGGNHS
jgi:hypothetical protein